MKKMGKCPLIGKCTGIDKSLLSRYSDRDLDVHYGSEKYRFEHIMCKGKGTPPDQWLNCVNYDSEEAYKRGYIHGEPVSTGGLTFGLWVSIICIPSGFVNPLIFILSIIGIIIFGGLRSQKRTGKFSLTKFTIFEFIVMGILVLYFVLSYCFVLFYSFRF